METFNPSPDPWGDQEWPLIEAEAILEIEESIRNSMADYESDALKELIRIYTDILDERGDN